MSFHEVRLALEPAFRFAGAPRCAAAAAPRSALNCMSATLFSEIQRLFERTYAQVGINLEDCLIDRQRCGQLSRLAGASARELSELARTFLRRADDQLYVGIYYSRWLIEQLERHDPRRGISDANIRHLIAFVEEINHALHAALSFQARRARDSSAKTSRAISNSRRRSIPISCCCSSSASFARRRRSRAPTAAGCASIFSRSMIRTPTPTRILRGRYLETTELAQHYTRLSRRAERRAPRR